MNRKKRLLIIPARSGSKRVPNKNIRNFCGKPMITHSIENALKSNLFDEIHVSTESPIIKGIVENAGVIVPFMRPANLSDDFVTTIDVYKFVLNNYLAQGMCFDEVWTLLPCAPLISAVDLYEAYNLFLKYESKFPVISVVECNCHQSQSFKIENDFLLFSDAGKFKIRSQDLELSYKSAGAFGIFPPTHILDRSIDEFSMSSIGYLLSKVKAVDIDTEDDWELAEAIFYGKKHVENAKN